MRYFITCFSITLVLLILVNFINGQEITILHTNDLHSKINGTGPEFEYTPLIVNNDKTVGGFARLATIFKQVEQKSPESTLILDAGDFLMGSLFQAAEEETGFQTSLMKKMGYDFITLGNHEFDFGPESLAKIIQTADKNDGIPQIVISNLEFSKKSVEDDELQLLFSDDVIQPFSVINKNGLKIGIFGLIGSDAANVAPASKPVKFSNPAKKAKKIARYLKNKENVDIVILLSHSGIGYDKIKNRYFGEDIELAKKAPEIDIIIGAHTHTRTSDFIKTGNTYIVQTGSYGAEVGKIDFRFTNGEISDFRFELLPVNDQILGDAEVHGQIEDLIKHIDFKYLSDAGLKYSQIVGKTSFDLTMDYSNLKNSNLGTFIADATYYYLNNIGDSVDFCLIASGTIRENLVAGESGIITVPDVFRVMSLGKGTGNVPGYPLTRVYLTGHEVKQMMEALLMSRNKGGDGFIYFSGIKTWIDSDKGMMNKVQKVEIGGKEISFSKKDKTLYPVAANIFLVSFMDRIKKLSYGLLRVVPKDKNGKPVTNFNDQLVDIDNEKEGIQEAKEWIALIEYIKSFEKNNKGIPVIPATYKNCEDSVMDLAR
ncbi:MAG: bifunctional metallophosphatase/5'-nucleotidase [Bacteroidetes bacterium]|nr:MAG: bifunctional metallophosphatase/5'-nucleotidase [Bacteroidota bacterium]